MNTNSLIKSIGISGAAMALLSATPIINLGNCLLCMWIWGGAMFGVWLYQRSEKMQPVTVGQGAAIGALSGVVGAIIGAILGAIFGLIMPGASTAMLDALSQISGQDVQDMPGVGGVIGSAFAAGAGSLIGMCFTVPLYAAFGALGGLIGASIFGKAKT